MWADWPGSVGDVLNDWGVRFLDEVPYTWNGDATLDDLWLHNGFGANAFVCNGSWCWYAWVWKSDNAVVDGRCGDWGGLEDSKWSWSWSTI